VLEEGEGLWIDSDNIARPQEWERDRETERQREFFPWSLHRAAPMAP
jgi:hypothetical protein